MLLADLFDKVPANSGYIDDIDLPAIGLRPDIPYPDTVLFGQLLIQYHFSEFVDIGDLNAKHKILGEFYFVVVLEDEPATVTFQPGIAIGFPINMKAQLLEELLGAMEVAAGRNERFERKDL